MRKVSIQGRLKWEAGMATCSHNSEHWACGHKCPTVNGVVRGQSVNSVSRAELRKPCC